MKIKDYIRSKRSLLIRNKWNRLMKELVLYYSKGNNYKERYNYLIKVFSKILKFKSRYSDYIGALNSNRIDIASSIKHIYDLNRIQIYEIYEYTENRVLSIVIITERPGLIIGLRGRYIDALESELSSRNEYYTKIKIELIEFIPQTNLRYGLSALSR